MRGMLWRVIIAVICFALFIALLPPVLHVIGFPLSRDLEQIVRICAAGLAILYIIWGPAPPPPFGA